MKIKYRHLYWAIYIIFITVLCLYRSMHVYGTHVRLLRMVDVIAFSWSIGLFLKYKFFKIKELYPMFFILVWMLFTTIINGAEVQECFRTCYKMFAVICITQRLSNENAKRAVVWIARIWTVLLLIQLYSLYTGCFGLNTTLSTDNMSVYNYFLGTRVTIDQYIIYALFFNHVAAMVGGKKERLCLILSIISGGIFVIQEWVSTSILGLAVFYLICLGDYVIKNKKFWNAIALSVLLFAGFFFVLGNTNSFRFIIVNLLRKDITLSCRTELWDWTIHNIKGLHWIIGYGNIEQMQIPYGRQFITHPHNNYLEFLYKFGCIGLALYINQFVKIFKKVKEILNNKLYIYILAATVANIVMAISSKNFWFMTAQIFFVLVMNSFRFESDNTKRV